MVLGFGALFLPFSGRSAINSAPSQRELNGFLLGQYRLAVTAQYGQPFQTRTTEDGWVQRIYWIDKAKRAYMVFESVPSAPATVYAVQLSGKPGTRMLPFKGLLMGASRQEIYEAFGEPTGMEPLGDIPGESLRYAGRNYSFEVDGSGKLQSIRIVGFEGFETKADASGPKLAAFIMNVKRRDIDAVMDGLTPDAEIYRGGSETVSFKHPARRDLNDPSSPMYRALFAGLGGLGSALSAETASPEGRLRLRDNGVIDWVFTYPKGTHLEEIVFKWQAGAWRVWEVAQKDAGGVRFGGAASLASTRTKLRVTQRTPASSLSGFYRLQMSAEDHAVFSARGVAPPYFQFSEGNRWKMKIVVNRMQGTYVSRGSTAILRKTQVNGRAPRGDERKPVEIRILEGGRAVEFAGQVFRR